MNKHMSSRRTRRLRRLPENNAKIWTRFLAKPSTITLILLLVAIITLGIVSQNPQTSPQFYTTLDTIIKVVLGTWGGAMFGEHYKGNTND